MSILNNEFVVKARFTTITAAGTYTSTLSVNPTIPANAVITSLVVRERTALAGGTSYQFVVDSISGVADTNVTGAVALSVYTGVNELMSVANGVVAAMTSTTAVVETGTLKLITLGTTSAGDIDVIIKFTVVD